MATAQILFRVDLDTKAQIATAAKTQGVSINQWLLGAVAEALAAPPPVAPEPQTLASILARLDALETLVAELTRPTAITDSTPTIIPSPPDPVAPPDPEPQLVHPDPVVEEILKDFRSKTKGCGVAKTVEKLAQHIPTMDTSKAKELLDNHRDARGKEAKDGCYAEIIAFLTTP
jgi:hypothetical protein